MASTELEFQPANSNTNGKPSTLRSVKQFFWNPQKREFFGRTGPSWLKICAFYLIFYACLAAFFAVMLVIFFQTMDDKRPTQTDMNSLIKGNPGLSFRPMPDIQRTLIKFQPDSPGSYAKYKRDIVAIIAKYQMEHNKYEYEDCPAGQPGSADAEKACKFELSSLGTDCTEENNFGYSSGAPCILIKMNKIFDWEPELYTNETAPDGVETTSNGIAVTCEGENYGDIDNLGEVEVVPAEGFLIQYFPYTNNDGYQAPLVFARLKQLKKGVLTQVWCKAWADNIYHDKNDKAGSTHFEVLMD